MHSNPFKLGSECCNEKIIIASIHMLSMCQCAFNKHFQLQHELLKRRPQCNPVGRLRYSFVVNKFVCLQDVALISFHCSLFVSYVFSCIERCFFAHTWHLFEPGNTSLVCLDRYTQGIMNIPICIAGRVKSHVLFIAAFKCKYRRPTLPFLHHVVK